ncbi:MAG: hypothetical protein U1F36_17275 [Planctomycetota bacterium]
MVRVVNAPHISSLLLFKAADPFHHPRGLPDSPRLPSLAAEEAGVARDRLHLSSLPPAGPRQSIQRPADTDTTEPIGTVLSTVTSRSIVSPAGATPNSGRGATSSPAPMSISVGGPITNTRARRVTIARSAAALARTLDEAGRPEQSQPWWSPCLWRENRRLGANWSGTDCLALDVDHDDRRALTPDERSALHQLLPRLPGSVFYHTPKGFRVVAILSRPVDDQELVQRAQLGFAEVIARATASLAWLHVDRSVTADAAARALYTPRGNAKPEKEPHPRDFPTLVLSEVLFDVDELAALAPPPTPRAPKPPRVVPTRRAAGSARASSSLDEAAQRWNADHRRSFLDPDRECPACGHRGCFGPLPDNQDRWFCFSANHEADSGGCGLPAPSLQGWSGDALDLEARQRGLSRVEVLRQDGYLDRLRHEPRPSAPGQTKPVAGPTPGSIIVSEFGEAHAHVSAALRSWAIGDKSKQIVGATGSGKTTAARRESFHRLRRGQIRIGILAEHTADLVMEKAKAARDESADDGAVEVVELLGARPGPTHGFLCSHPEHRAEFAELGVFACEGCPLFRNKQCETQPGNYRHDSADAMERIRTSSRVLVVTTHARLPMLLRDLGARLNAPDHESPPNLLDHLALVIDDDGRTAGGLLLDQVLQADIVESALDHADRLLAKVDLRAAWNALERGTMVVPDVVLADIVRRVLRAIEATTTDSQPIRAVLEELTSTQAGFLRALHDGRLEPPWTSFERPGQGDGEDRRPALSDLCIRLLRLEHLQHGVTVTPITYKKRVLRWSVRVANVELAALARAGRVCWLSIGALPTQLTELFDIESALLESRPTSLTTLAVSDFRFGRLQGPIVNATYLAVHECAVSEGIKFEGLRFQKPGGILRKSDRDTFAKTSPTAYDACGHYGAAHSATDRFADRDVFVIGRHFLPMGTIQHHARALRRAFPGLPPVAYAPGASATIEALVGWWGQPEHWPGRVFIDPLEADIHEAWRRQHLVNAAGRIRALSGSERKLLIILDRDPCPGLFVDRELNLHDLVSLLDLQGEDIARAIQACADEAEQRARSAGREREDPENPLVAVAEAIIARWISSFGVAPTLKVLRSELAGRGVILSRDEVRALRAEVEARKKRDQQSGEEPQPSPESAQCSLGAHLVALLPTASAIAHRTGVSERTVERRLAEIRDWLSGGPPPILSRSHAQRNWIDIIRAIRSLMTEAGTWSGLASHPFADAASFEFGDADQAAATGERVDATEERP